MNMTFHPLLGSTKSTVALREKLIRCFAASEDLIAIAVADFEAQAERTLDSRLLLSRQLLNILDELLAQEDWGVSPFITQLLKPTRKKREELIAFIEQSSGNISKEIWQHPVCPPGSKEAYILLYQATGGALRDWESQMCDLHRMAVSRPLYATQDAIERCIRHRGNQLTDAYALIHLPEDYLQANDDSHLDKYGQELMQFRKTNLETNFIKALYYLGDIYTLEEGSLIKMKQGTLTEGAN